MQNKNPHIHDKFHKTKHNNKQHSERCSRSTIQAQKFSFRRVENEKGDNEEKRIAKLYGGKKRKQQKKREGKNYTRIFGEEK